MVEIGSWYQSGRTLKCQRPKKGRTFTAIRWTDQTLEMQSPISLKQNKVQRYCLQCGECNVKLRVWISLSNIQSTIANFVKVCQLMYHLNCIFGMKKNQKRFYTVSLLWIEWNRISRTRYVALPSHILSLPIDMCCSYVTSGYWITRTAQSMVFFFFFRCNVHYWST